MRAKTFWSLETTACLAAVQRAYEEEGRIGQTVRHYYYKLLSAGAIRLLSHPHSADNAYDFVSRLLTDARLRGVLPWPAVVDPGRRSFTHWCYESLAECVRVESQCGFTADIWRGQPRRLEVWVEKDGIAEFVHGVVDAYHVPVYVAKGYASETVIKDASDRYGTGRGWTLLYAGDFDPSGLDIERNLRDTLREHGARPVIERVALTREDTAQYPGAALALKPGDSRYKPFVAEYGPGQKGYELEAMPASRLRQKLLDALALYMDLEELATVIELERAVRELVGDRLRDVLSDLEELVLSDDWFAHGWRLDPAIVRRYLAAPDRNDDSEVW